eukprot:scaffold2504_cov138-Skeletonema_marinoi.AAC.5
MWNMHHDGYLYRLALGGSRSTEGSQDYIQTVIRAPPAQPPPIAPIAHLPSKNSGDNRGSVFYEENIMSSCTGTAMCHEGGGRNYNRFLIAGVYILVVVGFLKHADILQQQQNDSLSK